MDIGKQQRVIIVELEKIETPSPARIEESAEVRPAAEAVGEWPLPFDIYAEPVN